MKLFRSVRLKKILIFLLLVLLNAGPFGFVKQHEDVKRESFISSPYYFDELSCQVRQLEIKYGFDVIHISVLPIITRIISADYIIGIFYDSLSTDFLTNPDRAPPRHTVFS